MSTLYITEFSLSNATERLQGGPLPVCFQDVDTARDTAIRRVALQSLFI